MKTLALITSLVVSSCIWGQYTVDEADAYRHQLGANASHFITYLIGLKSDQVTFVDPTPLSYKAIINGGALRVSLGASLLKTKNEQSTSSTQSELQDNRLDLQIGYEGRKKTGKRWLIFYGADGIFGIEKQKEKINNYPTFGTVVTTNTNRIGIEGVLGAEFFIAPRFSISTEGGLALISQKAVTTFSSNSIENSETTSTLGFVPPLFVYARFGL